MIISLALKNNVCSYTFRSKEPARKLISTTELHDLSIFADILNDDVMKMTGKISSGKFTD